MTKEITKARILQELQDKFALREHLPASFLFEETVIPTYDIEQHLGAWEIKAKTQSITSATSYIFFAVGPKQRWLLRGYTVIFLATGAIKGSGLYITNRPPILTNLQYLDLTKGQEVSYTVNLSVPVVLGPNAQLGYLIDTYVSTQDLLIYVDILKEEIR